MGNAIGGSSSERKRTELGREDMKETEDRGNTGSSCDRQMGFHGLRIQSREVEFCGSVASLSKTENREVRRRRRRR